MNALISLPCGVFSSLPLSHPVHTIKEGPYILHFYGQTYQLFSQLFFVFYPIFQSFSRPGNPHIPNEPHEAVNNQLQERPYIMETMHSALNL